MAKKIVYIPEILVHYRLHSNQTTSSRSIYHYEDYKAFRKVYFRLVKEGLFELCYKSYVSRCIDAVIFQWGFVTEEEKERFESFWQNEGFVNLGMSDCKPSDFLTNKQYEFYHKIMSLPGATCSKMPLMKKGERLYNDDWDNRKCVLFPYRLFPVGAKVLLYGSKDICQAFLKQVVSDGGDVNIVDVSYDEDEKQIWNNDFQYVLICEKDSERAKIMKEKLLKMGLNENSIKWDGGNRMEGCFNKLYLSFCRSLEKIVPF